MTKNKSYNFFIDDAWREIELGHLIEDKTFWKHLQDSGCDKEKIVDILINHPIPARILPIEEEPLKSASDKYFRELQDIDRNIKTLINSPHITEDEKRYFEKVLARIYGETLGLFLCYDPKRTEIRIPGTHKEAQTSYQCMGETVLKLFDYIMPFVERTNEKGLFGQKKDYTQKDVYKFISDILNAARGVSATFKDGALEAINRLDDKKIKEIRKNQKDR